MGRHKAGKRKSGRQAGRRRCRTRREVELRTRGTDFGVSGGRHKDWDTRPVIMQSRPKRRDDKHT